MHDFELSYPNGPHIRRGRTEAALKEFFGRIELKVRDVGTGWVWYRLPTFLDGELGIGIELGFNQGGLRQLYVLGQALSAIHRRFSPAYGPASGNDGWYAMDVEFKFDDEGTGTPRLFVKQARPYPRAPSDRVTLLA